MPQQLLSKSAINSFLQIAEKCTFVRKDLRIGSTSLTPVNYNDEKEKFLKSKTYNPIFHYEKFDLARFEKSISDLKKEIDTLFLPRDLKNLLHNYTDNLKLILITKQSIGTEEFSKSSHKLLGWDKFKNLKITSFPENGKSDLQATKVYNAKDIQKVFRHVINKKYKLKGFEVITDSHTNYIISAGYDRIRIGSKVKRNQEDLDKLIVHEVESHILQTYNLKNYPAYADLALYDESLVYSEGLAVFNEITTGVSTQNSIATYHSRYHISKMIDEKFRTIYDYLCTIMSSENAYTAAFRIKRGIKDTGQPGGLIRDAYYMLGHQLVKNYVDDNKSQYNLYKTKSPDLTKLLDKYNLLKAKKLKVPSFVKIP